MTVIDTAGVWLNDLPEVLSSSISAADLRGPVFMGSNPAPDGFSNSLDQARWSAFLSGDLSHGLYADID